MVPGPFVSTLSLPHPHPQDASSPSTVDGDVPRLLSVSRELLSGLPLSDIGRESWEVLLRAPGSLYHDLMGPFIAQLPKEASVLDLMARAPSVEGGRKVQAQ